VSLGREVGHSACRLPCGDGAHGPRRRLRTPAPPQAPALLLLVRPRRGGALVRAQPRARAPSGAPLRRRPRSRRGVGLRVRQGRRRRPRSGAKRLDAREPVASFGRRRRSSIDVLRSTATGRAHAALRRRRRCRLHPPLRCETPAGLHREIPLHRGRLRRRPDRLCCAPLAERSCLRLCGRASLRTRAPRGLGSGVGRFIPSLGMSISKVERDAISQLERQQARLSGEKGKGAISSATRAPECRALSHGTLRRNGLHERPVAAAFACLPSTTGLWWIFGGQT
jgi:hypothetical protein